MTGFSTDWLALREPADHRARNAGLLDSVRARFGGRAAVSVVDLGCGTGSNLRALAGALPARQHWTLVDHDPGLVEAARARLAVWADAASRGGEGLVLVKDGRTLTVSFQQADLARDLDRVLATAPDLVTAAALLDLVSPAWIRGLAQAVVRRQAVFYTALIYDGTERWAPPHSLDGPMLHAFHAHQGRDKGFGPAAGPQASLILSQAFAEVGYRVTTGESPWQLGPEDADLTAELARGIAQAVRETGLLGEEAVSRWLESRGASASCLVGHTDWLAVPAEQGRVRRVASAE